MRKTLARIWRIFVQAGTEWLEDECPRYAASLSFYTVFSLAPLLVIVVAVVGVVFGTGAAHASMVAQVGELAGPQMARLVNQLLAAAARPAEGAFAALVALTTLVVGSTGVLVELRRALDIIWGNTVHAPPEQHWLARAWSVLRARLLTFSMLFAIGFLMLVSLTLSAYLAIVDAWVADQTSGTLVLARVVNPAMSLVFITLFFGALMLGLPSRRLSWRSVLPGAFVSALLFSGGKFLIGIYLGHAATTSVYGAASSVVVVMLWVYFSSMIFLFGAEVAEVVHRQRHTGTTEAAPASGDTPDTALATDLHDLRQPIDAVRLYAEELAREPARAADVAPRLADAARSAGAQLRELMARAAGRPAGDAAAGDCDLRELARAAADAWRPEAHRRGLALSVHMPPAPVRVALDAVRLRRIVGNLVANGVRYTDAGRVLVAVRRRGGRWVVEVRDTGRGMTPHELAQAFEPFRRGAHADDAEGWGLGLAGARRLADELGVRLEAASTPGHGSLFRLVLPA